MNWTVNRIAHLQASALGLNDAEKTALHRAARNIVMKDVVPSKIDESDSRGTRLLDDDAAAAVLLLVPLARLAMDVRGLREIANSLFAIRFNETESEIAHTIAKVKEGKTVTMVTKLRLHNETGKLGPFTAFKIEGEEPAGEVAELLSAQNGVFYSDLATVEVPTSDILRPFLS
jgi:hypothetical protein